MSSRRRGYVWVVFAADALTKVKLEMGTVVQSWPAPGVSVNVVFDFVVWPARKKWPAVIFSMTGPGTVTDPEDLALMVPLEVVPSPHVIVKVPVEVIVPFGGGVARLAQVAGATVVWVEVTVPLVSCPVQPLKLLVDVITFFWVLVGLTGGLTVPLPVTLPLGQLTSVVSAPADGAMANSPAPASRPTAAISAILRNKVLPPTCLMGTGPPAGREETSGTTPATPGVFSWRPRDQLAGCTASVPAPLAGPAGPEEPAEPPAAAPAPASGAPVRWRPIARPVSGSKKWMVPVSTASSISRKASR